MRIKKEHKIIIVILIAGVAALFVAIPSGHSYKETKLTPSDGAAGDWFGEKVAVSGEIVVVGSYRDDDDKGAVYIYKWNGSTWTETKVVASDGAAGDRFGEKVAVSGDIVVVGAIGDDDKGFNSGSIYIYQWDGIAWKETKLISSDGVKNDHFGYSVAINGNVVVVGVNLDDDNGNHSGSAYIYKWDGVAWAETKITASDGAAGDWFGESVAVSGNLVVVGSYHDDDNGESSGSVYIYKWNGSTWVETKLVASDGAENDWFGRSVVLDGKRIVAGVFCDDDNGVNSGSAYIYNLDDNAWLETKVKASDGDAADEFGFSVALSGDMVVIGAKDDDDNGDHSGSAYIYKWNGSTWAETKITAHDGSEGDWFGWSVAVDNNTIVVGAPLDDDNGEFSGSVYIYQPN